VSHGINSRQLNSNGHTALQCAAMGGHAEVVRFLHKIDCDVNAQTHDTGDTALHMAVNLRELLLPIPCKLIRNTDWMDYSSFVALQCYHSSHIPFTCN
jgi:hypothetical protein